VAVGVYGNGGRSRKNGGLDLAAGNSSLSESEGGGGGACILLVADVAGRMDWWRQDDGGSEGIVLADIRRHHHDSMPFRNTPRTGSHSGGTSQLRRFEPNWSYMLPPVTKGLGNEEDDRLL
jgi:hypothetical protein